MNIGNGLKAAKCVVTSKAGRTLLKGQKHSPGILFGAGVVGVVGSTVLACKATLKLESVIDKHEDEMGKMHDVKELQRLGKVEYSTKDEKKDAAIIKVRFVKDVCKLYAPAAAVGVVSLGALGGSHIILNRRLTGAVAAYATLDRSFREYQARVAELAPDLDQKKLLNGSESREIVEEGKNGPEVKIIDTSKGRSPYAKLFAKETTQEWSEQPDYNLHYIRGQQTYANDLLKTRGHVFLNEVYKELGLPHTKEGAVVGWVKNNKRGGDDYIDFGLFEQPDRFADFMAGKEGAIWLDFNVDGVVYDLI